MCFSAWLSDISASTANCEFSGTRLDTLLNAMRLEVIWGHSHHDSSHNCRCHRDNRDNFDHCHCLHDDSDNRHCVARMILIIINSDRCSHHANLKKKHCQKHHHMNDNHGGEWGNWGPTVGLHQVKSSSLSYRVARCQLSSLMSIGSFIVLNSLQYQMIFSSVVISTIFAMIVTSHLCMLV